MPRGKDTRDDARRVRQMFAATPPELASALAAFHVLKSNDIPNAHDPGGIAEFNHDVRAAVRPNGLARDSIFSVAQQPQYVEYKQ